MDSRKRKLGNSRGSCNDSTSDDTDERKPNAASQRFKRRNQKSDRDEESEQTNATSELARDPSLFDTTVAATSVARSVTQSQHSDLSAERIARPTNYDVLFGRGKPFQEHPGNLRLHKCVEYYRPAYITARRREKMVIAQKIVSLIKDSQPNPGRFLRRVELEDYWEEVPDDESREKVSHALRNKPKKSVAPSRAALDALAAMDMPSLGRGTGATIQQHPQQMTLPVAQPTMGNVSAILGANGLFGSANAQSQLPSLALPMSLSLSGVALPGQAGAAYSSLLPNAAAFLQQPQNRILPPSMLFSQLLPGNYPASSSQPLNISTLTSTMDPFILEAILEMRQRDAARDGNAPTGRQGGRNDGNP